MKKSRNLILSIIFVILLLGCGLSLWYTSYTNKLREGGIACMNQMDQELYQKMGVDFLEHSTSVNNSVKKGGKLVYQGDVIYKNESGVNVKQNVECFMDNNTPVLNRGEIEEGVERLQDEINSKIEEAKKNNKVNVDTEEKRIAACEERAGFYLNFNSGSFTWQDEEEAGASFARDGHVLYEKRGEVGEDDIFCYIDMVDGSVNVEFSDHKYDGPIEQ